MCSYFRVNWDTEGWLRAPKKIYYTGMAVPHFGTILKSALMLFSLGTWASKGDRACYW
jgi:hypothetical protein